MKNALFFGDSLTAGYGLTSPSTESFPALILQKITSTGLNYRVTNAGLSGDTTVGGLQRIDYWTSKPVDVFVLELGINDIIRGISPQTTGANLQLLINLVKQKYPGVKMALMGMRVPPFMPIPFAAQFVDIYPKLATKNQMTFVPFFLEGVAGIANLNLPDKLHPSAAGYKVIADRVWPVIKPLFADR